MASPESRPSFKRSMALTVLGGLALTASFYTAAESMSAENEIEKQIEWIFSDRPYSAALVREIDSFRIEQRYQGFTLYNYRHRAGFVGGFVSGMLGVMVGLFGVSVTIAERQRYRRELAAR